jgi:hypothetical protein
MKYVVRAFFCALVPLLILAYFLPTLKNVVRADGGDQPIVGDSTLSAVEWNEFYHSSNISFTLGNSYHISFDYKAASLAEIGNFYVLVQDLDQPNRKFAWHEWRAEGGKTGTEATAFTPADSDKYILIFGIQNQGAITISNVKITSTPVTLPPVITLPKTTRIWTSPGHTTYYFDSKNGSDAANGRSPSTAWRSLDKINTGTFGDGDHLLLRSGSAWAGFIFPAGSGLSGDPIIIDRYGSGDKPKIDAQEQWLTTLYISNSAYITVRNVDIANKGQFAQPRLTGVKVSEENFGTANDVVLDSLNVHDVSGSDVKDDGGGAGIDCSFGGRAVPTRFDGLEIKNCHLTHTDRNGITMSGPSNRNEWYPSLHVVIEHNVLDDIGGDGIVPIACDGCVLQYNTINGCRMRAQDYCAGIWPWSCDNTVVQFNEVSGMKGTNDGEGYDSDYNCRNTLIQYNYSHDNDGGFLLICDDGGQSLPYNIGNIGSIVRYNVSVNDGLHTFHISGPCSKTVIYNNTIYLGERSAGLLVASDSWGGLQAGTTFENNVFYAAHKVGFTADGQQSFVFANNSFWGNITTHPSDPTAVTSDPDLIHPGGMKPADYFPRSDSPLLNAGTLIQGNGGRDFAGNSTPATTAPSVGAFQK